MTKLNLWKTQMQNKNLALFPSLTLCRKRDTYVLLFNFASHPSQCFILTIPKVKIVEKPCLTTDITKLNVV